MASLKSLKSRSAMICRILESNYPNVKTQLNHNNPFELLVATILSAQCTDRQVNQVTGKLFERFKTPADFAAAPVKEVEKLVYSTGFFRNKSRHVIHCAREIQSRHNGRVPGSLDELVALPGVGRKTANVVLGVIFGIPGIVVDTHVGRISQRLDLTENKDPVKIEFDLMRVVEKKDWNDFSLRLIYFGRQFCKAVKPECPTCPMMSFCRNRGLRKKSIEKTG